MLVLYDYFRSSAGYRVRIALNLKGVDYVRHEIPLLENAQRSPAHLARNPQGLVPALEADGIVLTQSFAILDWLDARHPAPRLIPAAPEARAAALARAMVIGMDVHPINNLRVMRYLEQTLGADAAARSAWTAHWMTEGFTALEAMAAALPQDGPFLGGAAPDISDCFLVPQLFNARRFSVPLDGYPLLLRAEAAALANPAFAAAHPDRVSPGA
ncbi:maleylacetoacetate isomerase [Sphingomonas pokkalii]|uniref:Maleylacetoacetate isomerase n=1 Tax=Sphingomonas pokkalii TaxID=2175090 RepID=A0A2U0SEW3_9SPHN|nr:maleylacetoacetate isomerase [Sphingomonas pokkalii]PVX29870.1 maleylacetoacetate isomerase [Sphingomonas pokkalii]